MAMLYSVLRSVELQVKLMSLAVTKKSYSTTSCLSISGQAMAPSTAHLASEYSSTRVTITTRITATAALNNFPSRVTFNDVEFNRSN